ERAVQLHLRVGKRQGGRDLARAVEADDAGVERGRDREDADVQHHHRDQELDQAEAAFGAKPRTHVFPIGRPPPSLKRVNPPADTSFVWRHTPTAPSMRTAWSCQARFMRRTLPPAVGSWVSG